MITIVVIWAVGNLIAHTIYESRAVPTWAEAPWHEKLLRLAWPTGIIVYLTYPAVGRAVAPSPPPRPLPQSSSDETLAGYVSEWNARRESEQRRSA